MSDSSGPSGPRIARADYTSHGPPRRADRKFPEHLPPPRRGGRGSIRGFGAPFPFAPVAAAERGESMCAVSGAVSGSEAPEPWVLASPRCDGPQHHYRGPAGHHGPSPA